MYLYHSILSLKSGHNSRSVQLEGVYLLDVGSRVTNALKNVQISSTKLLDHHRVLQQVLTFDQSAVHLASKSDSWNPSAT